MYETHVRRRVPYLITACNLFYLLILGNNIFGQHLVSDKASPGLRHCAHGLAVQLHAACEGCV